MHAVDSFSHPLKKLLLEFQAVGNLFLKMGNFIHEVLQLEVQVIHLKFLLEGRRTKNCDKDKIQMDITMETRLCIPVCKTGGEGGVPYCIGLIASVLAIKVGESVHLL